MIFPREPGAIFRDAPRVLQAYYTPKAAPVAMNQREIFMQDLAAARAFCMAWKISPSRDMRIMMRIYALQAAVYIKYIRNEYRNARTDILAKRLAAPIK